MSERKSAIVAAELGAPAREIHISLRPPQTFQSNRLYDVHVGELHLILKEYLKPDEFDTAPVREFQALCHLQALDVAPQPLFYQPHQGERNPFVVYEYMEGEMWKRRPPSAAQLAALAELWLAVHQVTERDMWLSRGYDNSLAEKSESFRMLFERYASWAEASFAPAYRTARLCLSLLKRVRPIIAELDQMQAPLLFCRSDARFANIIQRPDERLGLVDWEDSGLRDPARDVVDLMTHVNQEDLVSREQWEPFLRSYLERMVRQDPEIERRVHLYSAIYPLFWLWVLIQEGMRLAEEGQLHGWQLHGMAPNERLRRYVARAQVWPGYDFSSQLDALERLYFFPE